MSAETPEEFWPEASVGNRFTVVELVYHQPFGEDPVPFECRFHRELTSSEQSYQRRVVVGENWMPLDTGWVERIGQLVIRNEEGRNLQRIPMPEEKSEIEARVVEVCTSPRNLTMHDPFPKGQWLIPPGERLAGCSADAVLVRCRKGTARCTVFAIPE